MPILDNVDAVDSPNLIKGVLSLHASGTNLGQKFTARSNE